MFKVIFLIDKSNELLLELKLCFTNDPPWPLWKHFILLLTNRFVWKDLQNAVNLKMHWHRRVNMHASQQEPTIRILSPLLGLVQKRA